MKWFDGKEWGKESRTSGEKRFLEGPRSRSSEFFETLHILWDCIHGFRKLHFVGPCVTVFGSARVPESDPSYALTEEMGARLAEKGFTVMTGGGPGLMEAANRGAKKAGGISIGCNIELPTEQKPNPYLDQWTEFHYFFVRKLMLIKYSYAFVAAPGGFGTLDEIFETLVLIQTGKIQNFPMILLGKEYWNPLIDFFNQRLLSLHMVSAEDIKLLTVTDSPSEAADIIANTASEQFGIHWAIQKPWWKRFLNRLLK